MSLTLTEFQNRFKKIGKLVFMSQYTPPVVVELKRAHVALVDQVASEDSDFEFEVNDAVVTPLGQQIKNVCDTIDTVPTRVKSAADTYLRQFLAIDLGLSKNASYSQINTALFTQMSGAGATVAPSGDNFSNDDGLFAYFYNTFGITLPQSDTPTIPDSYITDEVL